ncbi:unnamed protein product [Mytilus coruscus]|uniref:Uncharacterized protein n=1 Tax=Mytilus coruscus TaxID=42192 RepID=A0A6J8EK91_MYTCO|nr:unnamed protein product [Mytilus coruscus]
MDYPFCNAIGLPIESLLRLEDSADHTSIGSIELSNGVVLELKHFLEKNGKGIWELAQLISNLFSVFALTNPKSIQSKIHRLCELKKKLNTANELEHEQEESPANSSRFEPELTCNTSVQTETFDSDDETVKSKNLLQYYSLKLKKKNERLQREISVKQEKLKTQQDKIGYFSIRNINKREEKARQTAKLLRASKSVIKKQKRLLHKAESQSLELGTLKTDNEQLKEDVNKLSKTQDLLVYSQKMKLKVQKKVSSLKIQLNKMKAKSEDVKDEIEPLKLVLKEKDHQIENLLLEISILKEAANFNLVTRNKDATFTDCVRLCVMELSGLEVAVEKVSPVIQTVCKHLFDIDLDKSQLPSSTTVQSIVDEGHYIAKTFISERLDQSENWGLNRDGTTRRKIKIVDTTITLDSGNVMSLGFNRIAHETAATITKVTQGHLSELAGLNVAKKSIPPQYVRENAADYVARSLEKLAYTMSDRASNEKLANTLLNEWRDEILLNFELNGDKQTVHSFHCMAHVLLGFHSYVKPELKQLETKLVEVHGPIGRDSLSAFKFWSKKELVIERVLRTTADVFGPVGDHHGVRDRWESHCSSLGIKSLIGNYKRQSLQCTL